MGDFRFTYGIARGPEGNFQARTDNLFASTDATPDVSAGNLFYTNNASATSITYFDVIGANPVALHQGKEIRVLNLDNNTTYVSGSQLRLMNGQSVNPVAGAVFNFIFVNSVWYEIFRSYNTANVINVSSSSIGAGANGVVTIGPHVEELDVLVAAASTFTLRQVLGGYLGQTIKIFAVDSAILLACNSAGAQGSFVETSSGGTSHNIVGSGMEVYTLVVQGSTTKWIQHTDES